MFSIERLSKFNEYLMSFWKLVYLNLLWILFSLLGLGVFGVGPATYALSKYLYGWLYFKDEPPVFKSFWIAYKEGFGQSLLLSWLVMGVSYIVIVNLFNVQQWYLQVANVLMLLIIAVGSLHLFNVMVALNDQSIREIIRSSMMIGIGYLHYTIITWTVLIAFYYLLSSYFPSLLILFGTSFIYFGIVFVGKIIIKDIEASDEKEEEINKKMVKGEFE